MDRSDRSDRAMVKLDGSCNPPDPSDQWSYNSLRVQITLTAEEPTATHRDQRVNYDVGIEEVCRLGRG